jgi:adenylate cyclase
MDILAAFSLLISVTVACEIFYSSYANKKLILNFEKEYYSKTILQTTASWLDEYFTKLEVMLSVLAKSFSFDEKNKLEKYNVLFLETLKNIPYTLSFYIAFKDGTYYQARTLDGLSNFQEPSSKKLPSYAKYAFRSMQKTADPDPDAFNETWHYLNEDYGVVAQETLPKAQYNPTKRDWYVTAELEKENVWSDIYLFKTTKTAGMTLSRPLGYCKDLTTATGIIGVDFAVRQFKGLLASIKASENSENYLVNAKNEIISTSIDMPTFRVSKDGASIDFVTTINSGNTVLEEAAKRLTGNATNHATFSVGGADYVASIQKLTKLPCYLLTISPQDDFTSGFKTIQRDMILLSLAIFFISFVVIILLSRRIANPIAAICESAKLIGGMDLEKYKPLPASNIIEIRELAEAMESMKISVATFTKYAPKDLVRRLTQQGAVPNLGGETKKLTLFFSDIAKFSTVSEKLPAEYLILHLSEYFDEMTKEIMRCNGVIDKYIGDAIMAMWGAPNPDDNQCINACYAAMNCQMLLEKLKNKWAPLGKPPLPTRIGIHSGSVIVGNIGSKDRMNFTSIGDTVNIASRLEGVNKYYGTSILVSESIENEARGKILFRVIDRIAVKGRSTGTIIYEPLCTMRDADDDKYYQQIELSAKSNEAFELYQNQEFQQAAVKYQKILSLFPETEQSITPILNRCHEFAEQSPENWTGIYFLTAK